MGMRVCGMGRLGLGGGGVGLPEAEGGSGGIEDDAEPAHVRDFLGIFHDCGTEADGFFVGGVDVVDEDIGEPGRGGTGDGVLHHAAAGAVAGGLEGGVGHAAAHVHVGEFPVEEAGVEGFCFADVGGGEFDVTEGICHGGESFGLKWWFGALVHEGGFYCEKINAEALRQRFVTGRR
jgi:hypothetical protein